MDLYCLQFPVFRIKIVELEPGVRTLTSQYNNLFKLPPNTARYHDDLKAGKIETECKQASRIETESEQASDTQLTCTPLRNMAYHPLRN